MNVPFVDIDSISIGQPVAAGAGAIPARPRTPVPFTGGMRGKEWT